MLLLQNVSQKSEYNWQKKKKKNNNKYFCQKTKTKSDVKMNNAINCY